MNLKPTNCDKITDALKKTHVLEIEALKKQIDGLNSINSNFSFEEEMLRQEIKNINKNSKKLVKKYKSSNMSNKEKLYCIMTEIKDIMINERKQISEQSENYLRKNIMSYLDGTSCSGYRRNNRNRNNRSRRSSRSRNSRSRNSRRRNSIRRNIRRYFDYSNNNLSNNEFSNNSNSN